jgi:hypothetical protein
MIKYFVHNNSSAKEVITRIKLIEMALKVVGDLSCPIISENTSTEQGRLKAS